MLGWLELACSTIGACLFKVGTGVLSETLSHMWGKLNLPIFLFKVGLLTLITMDSLIFLAKPCPSLPNYLEVLLGGGVTCVTAMIMYGRRILQVFL